MAPGGISGTGRGRPSTSRKPSDAPCPRTVPCSMPRCTNTPENPMTERPLSFQDLILRLHSFWSKQGCVILQPFDVEMGAGTFHPATTLRALGPKHWSAAYVQPSRRPTDGRYGEKPHRLQHYFQYQMFK